MYEVRSKNVENFDRTLLFFLYNETVKNKGVSLCPKVIYTSFPRRVGPESRH